MMPHAHSSKNLKGRCFLCRKEFPKTGMPTHLKNCKHSPSPDKKSKKETIFRLSIESSAIPLYWLYAEIPGKAKLSLLDEFLREIWLECCGHLSEFKIHGVRYCSTPAEEEERSGKEKSMDYTLDALLSEGDRASYLYDYGTPTELTIHVLDVFQGCSSKKVHLIAQNNTPEIRCIECGKKAELVCSDCLWDDKGWLCETCSCSHKCGPDHLLPIVNSPRVGQCRYTGELK
ncbi:MAG: hypothetical protein JW774_01895 [Candidatus Aureabacteria bacterium]|nr:hypothetical protein [Candidatus Auribacterota bacterium]